MFSYIANTDIRVRRIFLWKRHNRLSIGVRIALIMTLSLGSAAAQDRRDAPPRDQNSAIVRQSDTRIHVHEWLRDPVMAYDIKVDDRQSFAGAYKDFQNSSGYMHNVLWHGDLAETGGDRGHIQIIPTDNISSNAIPNIVASLPYLRPELESTWFAVGTDDANGAGAFKACGAARYWCAVAPANKSMHSEEFAGDLLKQIMRRYPYMTNEQARTTILTTAHGENPGVAASAITGKSGWGAMDKVKAMNGPAQFMGRFDVRVPTGLIDKWSNDISDVNLDQRRQDDTNEVILWESKKRDKGWSNGLEAYRTAIMRQFPSEAVARAVELTAKMKELTDQAGSDDVEDNSGGCHVPSVCTAFMKDPIVRKLMGVVPKHITDSIAEFYPSGIPDSLQGLINKYKKVNRTSISLDDFFLFATPEGFQILIGEYLKTKVAAFEAEFPVMENLTIHSRRNLPTHPPILAG